MSFPDRRIGLPRRRFLALAAVTLVGCSAPAATAPAATSQPAAKTSAGGAAIKVGVPVNLTGGLAVVGIPVRDGVQLAADEINEKGGVDGRKIELMVEDTQTANDVAVNAIIKLLADKPIALIGLPLSNQVLAGINTLKEAQVPSIVFGTNPTIGPTGKPWVFQIQSNNEVAVSAATQFMVEKLGKKKVGVITANDENGVSAAEAAHRTLDRNGLKAITSESYKLGDKDMSAQILKLRNSGVDGIVSWGDQIGMALVIRQVRQLGIDIPMISGTLVSGTLETLTDSELDGQYIAYRSLPALDTDPRIKAFADAYKKRFNRDADEYAAMAYDAMLIIAEGVRQGNATPEALMKYIASLKDFNGVCCPHTADANQQLTKSMVIAKLKGKVPEPASRIDG